MNVFVAHFVRYRLTFIVVAIFAARVESCAQQSEPVMDAASASAAPSSFASVIKQNFTRWDRDGDGTLSREEIEAAVASPKFRDEAAAAIAAIEKVVRNPKYSLPPITKDYLASSPLREPAAVDEQEDSTDDVSKPGKLDRPPSFQKRYLSAIRKLRGTSRELFPQSLPLFEAVHQGALGDCPFVSTVGAMVYRDPAAVKAMFSQAANGSTTVSFGNGQSLRISRLTDADIAIWSSAGTNGLWLTILEKAYRRALVATEGLGAKPPASIYEKFGSTRTIEILGGHQTRRVLLREIQPGSPRFSDLRRELDAGRREHRLMKTGTPSGTKKLAPGITGDHAYAILGYNDATGLVRVWNPHGNDFTPKGPDGLQNGYATRGGEFEIPLKDMLQLFTDIVFETRNPYRPPSK